MKRLVLDTSVIVEYIVDGRPYRTKVAKLFEKAEKGELELFISAVTVSETLYVASRIYRKAGTSDPNSDAMDLLDWVSRRARIVYVNEDIALIAGELKKKLRIALADCYVIATAKAINAVPLFRSEEKEMEPFIEELRRYGVRFLNEITL